MEKEVENWVAFVSTYPPRECGIATFTEDLTSAIQKRTDKSLKNVLIALNNNGVNIYNYGKIVKYQINDTDVCDYVNAANFINNNEKIKLVCIQHEFGIFGGTYGDYLLAFIELINKPIILNFHSVMPNPNKNLKKIVGAIADRVEEIVVMNKKAVSILRNNYGIRKSITVIPHGIPTVNMESQKKEKENLNLQGKFVLSSFGMMSRGKGYEYVIDAVAKLVKKHPNLLYLIIGETHPIVRKREGEAYRNFLEDKIDKLKLKNHVKFYNKYLSAAELINFLKASDLYISSSQDPNQITSGTLAYAVGAGRVVVSTPFLHALDLLTPKIGVLTKFKDSTSFKEKISYLISNQDVIKEMEKNAYYATRKMTWPNVASSYIQLFKKYIPDLISEDKLLPEINVSHLQNLTDDFGVIQFAKQSNPDVSSGYTLDDNARALVASTMLYKIKREFKQLSLIRTYLNFIRYVLSDEGTFYNYVDRDRKADINSWSEDAHGRAIWALGYLTGSDFIPSDLRNEAEKLLISGLSRIENTMHLRSAAFTISGLYFYNQKVNDGDIKKKIVALGEKIVDSYKNNSQGNWRWFEKELTYANSKIPEALLYAYKTTKDNKFLYTALDTLDFLTKNTLFNEKMIPIGERGWYKKGGERAMFDQQPVDVAYTVQTLILAYKITNQEKFKNMTLNAFQWFLGKNTLGQVVYNEVTGGCHDGIGRDAINLNQGAESTIAYLLARLSMTDIV
ncbi:MAG: glycosyltransferase [Nanoarchaeota archaeon]